MGDANRTASLDGGGSALEQERLVELERRSLLAEQARQLAHDIRTPLSVIDLICETIQLELQADKDKSERIDQVLSASAKVSAALTEALRRARFTDGGQRPVPAAGVAARLTMQCGGGVEDEDGVLGAPCEVIADPDAFEAAVLHALRLMGGGLRGPRLILGARDARLRLRIEADPDFSEGLQAERADRRLMLQAIERLARDCGGKARHEVTAIELELPLSGDSWSV